MYVLAVGYPIWTFCANAAETASEARVRNDANFILDQTGREAVVNTGGGASSRKRSGRILTSKSPLDGALYGAEQGQGIPQLVSKCPQPSIAPQRSNTKRDGRNRLTNEHQNSRTALARAGRCAGEPGRAG